MKSYTVTDDEITFDNNTVSIQTSDCIVILQLNVE